MASCDEKIYDYHFAQNWGPYLWFPFLLTILSNIICFFGIIGNIFCILVFKKLTLVKANDGKLCSNSQSMTREEKLTFINQIIAFANIILLAFYYIFQMISFSEHVFLQELTDILIERELDQFGRWTSEILYYCQDSIQCFILMLFFLIILDQYLAVFKTFGVNRLYSNSKLVIIYIVIVGMIIFICQSPNILLRIVEMKTFRASLLSLKNLLRANLTEKFNLEFNVSKEVSDSDIIKDLPYSLNFSSDFEAVSCDSTLYTYEQMIFFILNCVYEIFCNIIPFFMYDKNIFLFNIIQLDFQFDF